MKLSTSGKVIGLAAVGAVAYFGWRWWKDRQGSTTTAASSVFKRPTSPLVQPVSGSTLLSRIASVASAPAGGGYAEQPGTVSGSKSYSFSL